MKARQIKQTALLMAGFLLSAAYMNGSRVNWDEVLLEKVDLGSRNRHARELLGPSYRTSAARLHESNRNLSLSILQRVRQSLPQGYAGYAAPMTQAVLSESKKYGFDPMFVLAVIQTESQWNPTAIGGVGEIGLMQIRPETARWIASRNHIPWKDKNSLKNPTINVTIGIAYLAHLREQLGPNATNYVSAYNMGPKALRRLLAQRIHPREYRSRVISNYEALYREMDPINARVARL